MKKLEKGFTLIELMIVVAIIAILAAVAAPKFGQQIKKSKDAKALAVVGNWRSGNTLFYSEKEDYATLTGPFADAATGMGQFVDDTTIRSTMVDGTNPALATLVVGTGVDGVDPDGNDAQVIEIEYTLEQNASNITEGAIVINTTAVDTKAKAWNEY